MGCPSFVEIGDNLTFSVCTHDPDTGVLTDADAVPSYRVYEDETATAILTGNMAKLDDGNTTGFYTETIACTAGNGFEDGKTYTVYIAATVDSDTGGITYGFKAITALATQVNAEVVDVLRTDTIPDSYSTDGSQPTFAQAILAILQFLTEKSVSGTTVTVNKPDGSTAAFTLTLNSSTNPSSITRAT